MSIRKKTKTERLQHFKRSNEWKNHRHWYIFTAAKSLSQPFSLDELRDGIWRIVGVRPRAINLLEEAEGFNAEHVIALISRAETCSDLYTLNPDIDLSKEGYRRMIKQPQKHSGRPPKDFVQTPQYHRQYVRHYYQLTVHPEMYLAQVFRELKQATADELAKEILEITEGVYFSTATIKRLLDSYIKQGRGPPHLREIQEGVYRRARKF